VRPAPSTRKPLPRYGAMVSALARGLLHIGRDKGGQILMSPRGRFRMSLDKRSRRNRKRVEMLFAHLKRILRLGRLRLRGPRGAQDEFTLAAIAQNLRRLAKLVARPPPAMAQSLA